MKKYFLIIALSLASASIFAQSATFLNIAPDAATLGMAGASIALDANAFALYNNPAAMALTDAKGAAAVSYGMWQPTASHNNLISAFGYGKTGNLALGIGGRFFTYQPYDITSDQGVVSGTYKPKEYDLEIGAAYKIWRFSLGASFRFIGSNMGGEKAGAAFAADVSLMYKWKTLSIALAAANLGTNISYGDSISYSLPSMVKLGLAYNIKFLEKHRVTLGLEGDYLFNGGLMVGGGVEYSYNEMAFVRCGYHYGDSNKAIPSYASVGAGAKLFGVTLDVAYLIAGGRSPMKNTLSLAVGYTF